MQTAVKICCIKTVEEAQLAIRAGADAIGLVSEMPRGPGIISLSEISRIASSVPPTVDTFLLTSKFSAGEIIRQHQVCQTSTIQIVDRLPQQAYAELRETLSGVTLVQVVHVSGETSVSEAERIAGKVDALLLDSGNPSLARKELGGTGRTHDWKISHEIVQRVTVPVYLAGGLTPSNIQHAARAVHPFGFDVCSGLRSRGSLDAQKVCRFMKQIRILNSPT